MRSPWLVFGACGAFLSLDAVSGCGGRAATPPRLVYESTAILPSSPPPPPPAPPGSASIADAHAPKALERAGSCKCTNGATLELQRAVLDKGATVRRCYERALRGDPRLEGKLMVELAINEDGSVCSSTIASHTFPSATVPDCVAEMMGAGIYPKPEGGCVQFNIPIIFKVPKT